MPAASKGMKGDGKNMPKGKDMPMKEHMMPGGERMMGAKHPPMPMSKSGRGSGKGGKK